MINLDKDEQVVLRAKKHWGYLIVPLVATFFTGGILFPWFLCRLLRHLTDEIVVTDKKFYVSSGIISKEVFAVPLEDMNNISYEQGLLGRTLRYGTFHFHSVAIADISACSGISNPEMVKAVIEQEIAKKKKSAENTAKSEMSVVINQTFGQNPP